MRFWRSFKLRLHGFATQPRIQSTLEDAAETANDIIREKQIEKPRADNTEGYSRAMRNILDATANLDAVAVQIGSLLVLKWIDEAGSKQLRATTLTPSEAERIEANPEILTHPATALECIGVTRESGTANISVVEGHTSGMTAGARLGKATGTKMVGHSEAGIDTPKADVPQVTRLPDEGADS